MADILFAGNDLATLTPTNGFTVLNVGTHEAGNASYSPGDIYCREGSGAIGVFSEPVLLGETVWVHCRLRPLDVSNGSGSTAGPMIYVTESGALDTKPAGIGIASNQFKLAPMFGTDLSGSVSFGPNGITFQESTTITVDIELTLDPVLGKIVLYINGVLASAHFTDTTLSGQVTQWDQVVIRSPGPARSSTTDIRFSEVLISRKKTIGQRVLSLYPNADGDRAEWNGSFSNVNSPTFSAASALNTDTIDAVHLLQLDDLPVSLPTDLDIAAVITSLRASDGGNGTANSIQHMVKTGGAEFASADIALPVAVQANQYEWAVNPQTGLPWVRTEIDALQMGMKARP